MVLVFSVLRKKGRKINRAWAVLVYFVVMVRGLMVIEKVGRK